MMRAKIFVANDSYENANDTVKNGVLLGCHQGLTEHQFEHIESVYEEFLISIVDIKEFSERRG